ncbi:MAG: hypothetical protein IJV20_11830 [Prevotella sp.]|nr:hypothetical protein [Prevotella sp.]
MRKIYLFAGLAAMMLASCSSNDKLDSSPTPQQPDVALEEGVVGFDAYTQRTTTRSGASGIMSDATLQTSGFGVFGYYTDNNDYEQSRTPDFFYNQKVEYSGGAWIYEPIKYWPNEYGSSAVSDDNDRVSFFAYAPYVQVSPSSGKLVKELSDDDQWGITGMSRNSAAGDPLVKYIASFENGKSVDLLWGVCDDPNWAIIQGGTTQKINEGKLGLPWLNVERPLYPNNDGLNNKRMKFTFKHALAQFSVNVDAFVDGLTNEKALTAKTKIYVRQISFTGFATKGALNLNNTEKDKALWLDYSGASDIESGAAVTIYDGRKDGKEGMSGADASNEKVRGLNPDIISNYKESENKGNTTDGVTAVTKPLFESTAPAMVIPTGEEMEVEIVYDVETEDPNLSTRLSDGKTFGSSIENRISKTVSFGSVGMENGKHYTLNLHLGMNSVQFDATVSGWVEADVQPQADLPANMPQFAAVVNPQAVPVTITSVNQDYVFAVTGLKPFETVTASKVSMVGAAKDCAITVSQTPDFPGTPVTKANASGIVYIKVNNIPANADILKKDETGYISVVGAESGAEARLEIDQAAHVIGLSASAMSDAGVLTLASTATVSDWTKLKYTLKKNGSSVVAVPTALTDNTITLETAPAAPALGDVYTITLSGDDVPSETYIANIGGISFAPNKFSVTYGDDASKLVPTHVGNGNWTATTYEFDPASTKGTTIAAATGVITTSAMTDTGDEVVKATATIANAYGDANNQNGWFYTTNSKMATYDLTVKKQAATISFVSPAATAVATTDPAAFDVYTLPATLKDAAGNVIAADGNMVNGAAIAYTVSDNTHFTIDANGKIQGVGGLAPGTYTITVEATVTDGKCYSYATKKASYNITVTINPAP